MISGDEKEKLKDWIHGMTLEQLEEIIKCIPSVLMWEELQRREKEITEKWSQISAILKEGGE